MKSKDCKLRNLFGPFQTRNHPCHFITFHRLTVALSLAATSLLHADALQVSLTKSQQLPLSKSDRAAQEVNLGWIPPSWPVKV